MATKTIHSGVAERFFDKPAHQTGGHNADSGLYGQTLFRLVTNYKLLTN